MILKIKAANPVATESWRFFDDVQGLHYSVFDGAVVTNPSDEEVEGVQYIRMARDESVPRPLQGYKTVLLTFVSDSTGPIEIYCDTTVYLLNDSGKTIEKII